MRAVVCRVSAAKVTVDGEVTGEIGHGLLVFVGVVRGDGEREAKWMADKLLALRIFPDDEAKMNRSVAQAGGGLLLISNFTLAGQTRKGTRPSFTDAAPPEQANRSFDDLVARCAGRIDTATGRFGEHMAIDSTCDGPVTLVIDTPPVR